MWNINNKGFTLIELLVVVSIIGILGSVTLAPFNQARMKGRDSKRVSEMKAIYSSLQMYADEHNGCYPDGSAPLNSANSLSADNYKYIPKTLYAKILNENIIGNSTSKIPAAWTAVQPYGYRGEGDFKECGTLVTHTPIFDAFGNFTGQNSIALSTVYLPSFQLMTELETHDVVFDGWYDSDKSSVPVDFSISSGGSGDGRYYFGLNLLAYYLKSCTNNSVGNWDCVYDLAN